MPNSQSDIRAMADLTSIHWNGSGFLFVLLAEVTLGGHYLPQTVMGGLQDSVGRCQLGVVIGRSVNSVFYSQ